MTTPARRHARNNRRRRVRLLLHRWHRRIGVSICIFIIWIVSSGWLINHGDALQLAQRQIHARLLLNWYGLKTAVPATVWKTDRHWLAGNSETIVLDGGITIAKSALQINGVTEFENVLFVAGESADGATLLLLSPQGELIDTLSGSALPAKTIARIGRGCDGVIVDAGTQRFATRDGTEWTPCAKASSWAVATEISNAQRDSLEPLLRPGISYERFLLDLHSGRILGQWGPYLIDAVGAGLMLLAVSGLWLFSSQRQHRRSHHHTPHNRRDHADPH